MCGIAGIINRTEQEFDIVSYVKKMSDALKHRGPDDAGYVFSDGVASLAVGDNDTMHEVWHADLPYRPEFRIEDFRKNVYLAMAHRRLSIIDLTAAGHQPMCNSTRDVWIVCNGELYNYKELRIELEAEGVEFVSHSDVEVLLKGYERQGVDFFNKMNGMWAFVIYDMRNRTIIGCRDRFGVKPMYFYLDDAFFAFASEQKALMKLPVKTSVNPEAVFDYLTQGKIEFGENGLYENIKELLPGHYFVYNLNTNDFVIKNYYTLAYNSDEETFSEERNLQFVEQTREKIIQSVRLRLRSDVPLGFCLSGGIDSSSIVGVSHFLANEYSAEQLGNRLRAYTALTDYEPINERKWADEVVKMHALQWHTSLCTSQKLFEELENIIYYQDAPLMSTSTYAQNSLMKLAKDTGIKILLDGQGGDELFAGYVPFYIAFYSELFHQKKFGVLLQELSKIRNSPLTLGVLLRFVLKKLSGKYLPQKIKSKILKKNFCDAFFIREDVWNEYSERILFSAMESKANLNSLLFDFFTNGYLKNLLRWEDRCSMQHSIESRTPFSDDRDLIEYVFSVPSIYKIHKGYSKHLLREAMKDFIPEAIYRRTDKLGFSTPQHIWLKQSENILKQIVSDNLIFDKERFADGENLLKNWDSIFQNVSGNRQIDFVWRYANFLLWRKINNL